MAEFKSVALQRLVLDENNPRFRRSMAQDEAIAEFAGSPKTRKLAKHISQFGLNPFDPIAVMFDPASRKYVVREGNRRTAALKLLKNADLAIKVADSKYYSALAAAPDAWIPASIPVVVLDDEREMRRWIRLKHAPDQGGVSTLIWQPWEKANFDDGSGLGSKYRHARELVSAALENNWINEEHHSRLNLSTLSRVLEDEKARVALGFSVDANGLHTALDVSSQEKLARRLVEDTGRGGAESSRTLRKTGDLVRYASLLASELSLKQKANAVPTRLGSTPNRQRAVSARSSKTNATVPGDLARKAVVTRLFRADITDARAAEILKELKKINVQEAPNAASLLFRIFLEFSVMHYAERESSSVKQKGPKDDLNTMIVRTRDDLLSKGQVSKKQIAVLNKSISTRDHFLSASQINQWVHNPLVHPTPREVNAAWNGVSDFLVALWSKGT